MKVHCNLENRLLSLVLTLKSILLSVLERRRNPSIPKISRYSKGSLTCTCKIHHNRYLKLMWRKEKESSEGFRWKGKTHYPGSFMFQWGGNIHCILKTSCRKVCQFIPYLLSDLRQAKIFLRQSSHTMDYRRLGLGLSDPELQGHLPLVISNLTLLHTSVLRSTFVMAWQWGKTML